MDYKDLTATVNVPIIGVVFLCVMAVMVYFLFVRPKLEKRKAGKKSTVVSGPDVTCRELDCTSDEDNIGSNVPVMSPEKLDVQNTEGLSEGTTSVHKVLLSPIRGQHKSEQEVPILHENTETITEKEESGTHGEILSEIDNESEKSTLLSGNEGHRQVEKSPNKVEMSYEIHARQQTRIKGGIAQEICSNESVGTGEDVNEIQKDVLSVENENNEEPRESKRRKKKRKQKRKKKEEESYDSSNTGVRRSNKVHPVHVCDETSKE